jgi:hypothetical protein
MYDLINDDEAYQYQSFPLMDGPNEWNSKTRDEF